MLNCGWVPYMCCGLQVLRVSAVGIGVVYGSWKLSSLKVKTSPLTPLFCMCSAQPHCFCYEDVPCPVTLLRHALSDNRVLGL